MTGLDQITKTVESLDQLWTLTNKTTNKVGKVV